MLDHQLEGVGVVHLLAVVILLVNLLIRKKNNFCIYELSSLLVQWLRWQLPGKSHQEIHSPCLSERKLEVKEIKLIYISFTSNIELSAATVFVF